ncbi:probable glutathione S-transferase [Lactuca sativa]|nr:probable glutathione S-transferase [Lactuca sativa]
MEETEVVVLGWQLSMFSAKVRIALAEKGIKYEYRQEDIPHNKSPLLLKLNPVYKKIPVLIHNGRHVCESKIIVEYIDETWKDKSPLLPSDPYLRSQARFWADYTDKIYEIGMKLIMGSKGEEMEKARQEFLVCLKVFEGELGEKPFFMGDAFGHVDIALISYYHHFYTYETLGNFSLKNDCPKLFAWATKCMKRESVSTILTDPNIIYEAIIIFRKSMNLED